MARQDELQGCAVTDAENYGPFAWHMPAAVLDPI